MSAVAFTGLLGLLAYALATEIRHNVSLVLLLLTMALATGAYLAQVTEYEFTHVYTKLMDIEFDAYISFDTLVHWQICAIYIKVAIEAKYLLDQRIYLEDGFDFTELNTKRSCLKIANIVNVVICVSMLVGAVVLTWMGDGDQFTIILDDSWVVL